MYDQAIIVVGSIIVGCFLLALAGFFMSRKSQQRDSKGVAARTPRAGPPRAGPPSAVGLRNMIEDSRLEPGLVHETPLGNRRGVWRDEVASATAVIKITEEELVLERRPFVRGLSGSIFKGKFQVRQALPMKYRP